MKTILMFVIVALLWIGLGHLVEQNDHIITLLEQHR
ncbi:hypothetical protein SAMN05443248_3040 [Bradyrhizobium erythrophlei]|uniref:Uncharacterized protein n=1 Tax=Bradyrhizobium erythrophlei TaxID=1437360 RepID=A0A1M5NL54_9BRAD|nr:hypothetical protein SAMN05443248_3040 [Bradyrhizobium erythrophlei]